ncbi:phospho-sugar mutase [Corynebacterium comes]|uniref:Phosphomannomutase n=1 Tax=Corynebacterium comes TaxID=2675218 RepID=A0A6B8VLH4_9CORY|nr:phospho-sugar mutase [Corynebacterium comes]QGU04923.1 putative phosphomannomutase [Corynebacterium comes]
MDPVSWAAHDPDPVTRAEVEGLIASHSPLLAERFAGPLTFGTAGLRGPVGGGESAMNIATVTRATAGLAAWSGPGKRVVVGCDARHRSADFRRVTAEVLSGAGVEVLLLPAGLPTPVTAFAVKHLDADAGVMITASHNPARDNGYKVYDHTGTQIIPPVDAEIATAMAAVGWADEVPRSRDRIQEVDVLEEYLARAVSLVDAPARPLHVVVTALHGVGGDVLLEALRRAGFGRVTPVAEQHSPDPDFPTVKFPNPEEPGALDLACATADRVGADLILALDPDADRCSVAIPEGDGWRQLTGDDVGALLGWDIASRARDGVLACSIVSSRLLGRIAAYHGLGFETTLTGFKWIARVPGLIYGYEEALGYCTDPEFVGDKDGITACLRVAELASRVDLAELLGQISERFGHHLTAQVSLRMADPASALAQLDGFDELTGTPGRIRYTAEGDRIIVRPSGTEPKLKCYLEAIAPTRAEAEAKLRQLLRYVPGAEQAPSSG